VETTGFGDQQVHAALDADRLIAMQNLVRRMPVPEKVLEAIIRLVRSARPEQTDNPIVRKRVEWGPSPRAGQALMLAARARALLRGRLAPSLDDLEALAEPALGHRMALAYDPTGNGGSLSSLIADLASKAS
jgi:MoxR-like ATPase